MSRGFRNFFLLGNRESGIGNRESGIGNRELGVLNLIPPFFKGG
ncbi:MULTISPECIES: hypothetical protein [unclassified Moorena]|nr:MULTISPECIES: hypothetical protein [unclassified Moorena]